MIKNRGKFLGNSQQGTQGGGVVGTQGVGIEDMVQMF